MSSQSDLRLDWCAREAALFAVKNWHYSRCLPAGKNQYIGVWERGRFIGAICFGLGAGNITKGTMYGLPEMKMAELTRVALTKHDYPVSRIVAIAIRMVKAKNPGLVLLVSLADPIRGHVGGIYQAGGWVYIGQTSVSKTYIGKDGREYHERVVSPTGFKKQYGKRVPCLKPSQAAFVRVNPGKHKYLMPLNNKMRANIAPLRQPYPKRERSRENAAAPPRVEGGVIPTRSLQKPAFGRLRVSEEIA
jgi:hypothetical protein